MARKALTREQYTPENYSVIRSDKDLGVLALADPTGLIVLAFSGRSQKPDFHYRYGTAAEALAKVDGWLKNLATAAAAKRARDEEEKAKGAALAVGDVLVCSWGYDQTNVDWYQITGRSGAETVEIRQIAGKKTSECAMSGYCTPVVGQFVGPAQRRRLKGAGVKLSSFEWASAAEFTEEAGVRTYNRKRWTAYA